MKLYDQPDVGIFSSSESPQEVISSQKAHVTATYKYLYKGAHTGRAMIESPMWYRISTRQQGEKWIVDPFIPEDILNKERLTDRVVKMTGNELLYDQPYAVKGKGVKASPGIVQAVASLLFNIKTEIYIWFKIQIQDGTYSGIVWVPDKPLQE